MSPLFALLMRWGIGAEEDNTPCESLWVGRQLEYLFEQRGSHGLSVPQEANAAEVARTSQRDFLECGTPKHVALPIRYKGDAEAFGNQRGNQFDRSGLDTNLWVDIVLAEVVLGELPSP